MLKRFREMDAELKSVVIFQPCTGRILMNDINSDKGKEGIQLLPKTLADINSSDWTLWSLREPADINEKDNNFPITA
jgi:hypothetical protein